jgi:hypothetical protein
MFWGAPLKRRPSLCLLCGLGALVWVISGFRKQSNPWIERIALNDRSRKAGALSFTPTQAQRTFGMVALSRRLYGAPQKHSLMRKVSR